MILVDSSVWIDHFRASNTRLAALLTAERVASHPFIIGELALGSLRQRTRILQLLNSLPLAQVIEDWQVQDWIERHALYGRGIGYVDVHLLASARIAGMRLWTMDKRLRDVARGLGLNEA